LKVNELINQDNPLFIGEFFGREARYEHDEVDDRVEYGEKHLAPLILSNYRYAGAAVRLVLQWYASARREGRDEGLPFHI
jgi:hypothetical protein